MLLNWFQAGGAISIGSVGGMNHNAKLTIKKDDGFKSYKSFQAPYIINLGSFQSLSQPTDSAGEALEMG